MTARRSTTKKMIDALKGRPYSKKELMKALNEPFTESSREALRKWCGRQLRKLQDWGLVEEREDKYCWYIYVNDFKGYEDRDAKLHSQKLIPALRRIPGIYVSRYSTQEPNDLETAEDIQIQRNCAGDHLRAYPEIWSHFDNISRIREKVELEKEKFNACLMNKLESKFRKKVVKSCRGIRLRNFVMGSIPSLVYSQILEDRPLSIEIEKEGKIWLGNTLVASGEKIGNRVRKFLEEEITDESNIAAAHQIWKIEMEAFAVQPIFQIEVRKLIMRLESGEPLLGGCDTCPEVYIRPRDEKV
jgi:hypothetical protein